MRGDRLLLKILGVAVAYWATARLGLLLAISPGYANAIWPPAGVALAALLIGGRRLWLGVLLGSLAANLSVGSTSDSTNTMIALSIAVGSTLQAVAGAELLRRFVGYPTALEAAPKIGYFMLLGGPVACLISASWGVTTLWSAGALASADIPSSWGIWWCGDMLGAMTITPLLLVLFGEPREAWRRRRTVVALPLCLAFAISVLVYVRVSAWESERMQRDFRQLVEPFDDLVMANLLEYLEMIQALRDFHVASQSIDNEEFKAFVEGPLARHRGISALSWLPVVKDRDRAAFEARLTARHQSPVQITERGVDGLLRAQERSEYLPVDYVQPLAENRRAVGYDVLSEPNRRAAINAAIVGNDVAATGPVHLARSDIERSVLMYVPVFATRAAPEAADERRAALRGCYAMVVQVAQLIHDSIEASVLTGISLEIADVTEGKSHAVLYLSEPAPKPGKHPQLAWDETLHVAGREWLVRTVATPAYIAAHGTSAPWGVLAGGLLFTSLLGGFLLLVSGRSHQAEVLATSLEARNRDLLEREAGLRRAQVLARSGHVITRADGSFESWSDTLERLIGRRSDDMPRTTRDWLELVHEDDRERFRDCAIQAGRTGAQSTLDYRFQRSDGEWIVLHQVLEPLDPTAARTGQSRWVNSIQDVTEQRHSEERIRRLNRVHAMLSSINGLVVRVRNREDLYHESCRIAVEQGGFGMAWIGELDPKTGDGRVTAWHGAKPGYVEKIRFSARADAPGADRPACVAARERRPVICNDVAAEPSLAPLHEDLLERGHRAVAALPLLVDGRVVAVITLFADEINVFDAEEQRLLDALASDIAFALDHLGKAEQIDTLAYFDPLTGLPNRHLLYDRMQHALAVASRGGDAAAVAFFDLDHFKIVNDSLGHDAGDQLLRTIAQRLKETVRVSDTVARLGGDEFVLLMSALGQL